MEQRRLPHDRIRGQGSFRRVMQAISICKIKGIHFSLQMVLNQYNFKEISRMAMLASHLGAKRLFFSHLILTQRNVKEGLSLTPDESLEAEKEV